MNSTSTDTSSQLRQFTAALFEPDDIVEIRRLPSGKSSWHRAAELAAPDVVEGLLKENAAGQNVYAGANPRRTDGGRKAEDVPFARSLFVDLDHMTLEDARQRLQGLPSPTMIVASGRGFHAYWKLTKPIHDMNAWTAWQKDLIALAGSDPAIHDPPRIMRLPGFLNHKPPAGPAYIIETHPEQHYDLASLHDVIPHIEAEDSNEPPDAQGKEDTPCDRPAPTADAGLERIARAAAWLRKRPGAVEGCTGDSHTYQTACNLVKDFGLSEAEAWPLLQAWNNTCRPPWDEADLRVKLRNAVQYAKHPEGQKLHERKHIAQPTDSELKGSVDEPIGRTPRLLSAAALSDQYPAQREPVIEGLARRGEVVNLVSGPKMYKSWALMNLALSTVLGRQFLKFQTVPGRVLMLDYELAPGTLAKRLRSVVGAMGVSLDDIGDRLQIEPLRGERLDVNAMGGYFDALTGTYDLVIVDPLYRTFPTELDENSNANLAAVYATLQRYAERLNAAMVVVHHLTKGDQSQKNVTDLGAGGGSQSRAADAHLAIRAHAEDDAAVLSGVVRSFPPFAPFCMRWQFPMWYVADELDPSELRQAPRRKPKAKPEEPPAEPEPPAIVWTPKMFADAFVTNEPTTKTAIIAMAEDHDLAERRAQKLLELAESQHLIHRWDMGRDQRTYYATIEQPPDTPTEDANTGGARARTFPPHTPPVASKRPGGRGVARVLHGHETREQMSECAS